MDFVDSWLFSRHSGSFHPSEFLSGQDCSALPATFPFDDDVADSFFFQQLDDLQGLPAHRDSRSDLDLAASLPSSFLTQLPNNTGSGFLLTPQHQRKGSFSFASTSTTPFAAHALHTTHPSVSSPSLSATLSSSSGTYNFVPLANFAHSYLNSSGSSSTSPSSTKAVLEDSPVTESSEGEQQSSEAISSSASPTAIIDALGSASRWRCPVPACSSHFGRKGDLKTHIMRKHPHSHSLLSHQLFKSRSQRANKSHPCPVPNCPSGFARTQELRRHFRQKHAGCEWPFSGHGKAGFRCPLPGCRRSFLRHGNLENHVRRQHLGEPQSNAFLAHLSTLEPQSLEEMDTEDSELEISTDSTIRLVRSSSAMDSFD